MEKPSLLLLRSNRRFLASDRSSVMGYDDLYMDEDGEPLMDPDAASDREFSPELALPHSISEGRKRGEFEKEQGKLPSSSKADRFTGQGSKSGFKGYGGGSRDDEADPEEEEEMWKTIAGGDSEDDQEGMLTVDDDNFIDDSGVDPADRYGSDNELFARNSPQGGKKKQKNEKSPAEIALIVEHLIAELEVTAEEDAELNRQNKPAINKLRKLSLLVEVLSKKKLQQEFLDHGVLTLLKNWLEPLPYGSLPTMNIRSAILNLLSDFPIDLEQFDRREQLKKSGLGKVIMFLSKSDEDITANRKLAKELVDKWSRPIFNKSTRFEDMRRFDDDRVPYRRPPPQKQVAKSTAVQSRDDDLDLAQFSQ
ncbi:hypothetical protein ZIOFF_010560 [Zingiber officinale]|uniref:TFIIS N-terminal domain-containing protein n=1 Tax=Zingiber officinale TaxID=94328 RepID=A0A8J5HVP1_ZINOF|nr:hypothetical protein ZIOFF_010560 [Zingiber officinale]